MLKSYVAFGFPSVMAELDAPDLRRSPVGQETVNGVRTTKYRIDHVSAGGSRTQGYAWLSAQGVLMRIDGTITRGNGGRPLAIRMQLANLAVGPAEPGPVPGSPRPRQAAKPGPRGPLRQQARLIPEKKDRPPLQMAGHQLRVAPRHSGEGIEMVGSPLPRHPRTTEKICGNRRI